MDYRKGFEQYFFEYSPFYHALTSLIMSEIIITVMGQSPEVSATCQERTEPCTTSGANVQDQGAGLSKGIVK